jgi:hypothetical protein
LTNRPKAIGTKGEVTTVAVCQRNGFPRARRLVLSGVSDKGDIHLGDGTDTIIEVKAGVQTAKLTPAKMDKWLKETRVERNNSKSEMAFLVTARAGYGLVKAEQWYAHIPVEHWAQLHRNNDGGAFMDAEAMGLDYVTITLGEALAMVKEWLGCPLTQ